MVSGLDISLSSPSKVRLNSEFTVSISSEDSDKIYDVKIFVHNSSDEKVARNEIISSVFNDGVWKDSYLYIQDTYPSQKDFLVKLDSQNAVEICAQLREKDKSSILAKSCNPIEISTDSGDIIKSYPEEANQEKKDANNMEVFMETYNDEPIRLSVKKVYFSKSAIQTRIISYSFTFLAILVIILIFLRKL